MTRDNPRLGELQPGDIVYIVERREVVEGTWRALVTMKTNEEPRGWVTAARDGMNFLMPDESGAGSSQNIKFNFFPHQMKTTLHAQNGLSCVHFS